MDKDKFFNALKKYIRNNFVITTSKGEYFGPNMYKDWEKRKYCFPGIFFYSEVHVENDKIKEVFDDVKKLGFEVKANRVRLRNSEHIDFTEEYYIIFSEESKLSRTIFRKKTVIYEYGSECIFVEYDLKKKKYCFYLDHRITLDKKSELINLYKFIEKNMVLIKVRKYKL